jgi:hypothetical protein
VHFGYEAVCFAEAGFDGLVDGRRRWAQGWRPEVRDAHGGLVLWRRLRRGWSRRREPAGFGHR